MDHQWTSGLWVGCREGGSEGGREGGGREGRGEGDRVTCSLSPWLLSSSSMQDVCLQRC